MLMDQSFPSGDGNRPLTIVVRHRRRALYLVGESGTSKPGGYLRVACKTRRECGGPVRIVTCIEDPAAIKKTLTHRDKKSTPVEVSGLPPCQQARLD
jgi:hypothetical protein